MLNLEMFDLSYEYRDNDLCVPRAVPWDSCGGFLDLGTPKLPDWALPSSSPQWPAEETPVPEVVYAVNSDRTLYNHTPGKLVGEYQQGKATPDMDLGYAWDSDQALYNLIHRNFVAEGSEGSVSDTSRPPTPALSFDSSRSSSPGIGVDYSLSLTCTDGHTNATSPLSRPASPMMPSNSSLSCAVASLTPTFSSPPKSRQRVRNPSTKRLKASERQPRKRKRGPSNEVFRCVYDECQSKFKRKADVERHRNTVHRDPRAADIDSKRACVLCLKVFSRGDATQRHQESRTKLCQREAKGRLDCGELDPETYGAYFD